MGLRAMSIGISALRRRQAEASRTQVVDWFRSSKHEDVAWPKLDHCGAYDLFDHSELLTVRRS